MMKLPITLGAAACKYKKRKANLILFKLSESINTLESLSLNHSPHIAKVEIDHNADKEHLLRY